MHERVVCEVDQAYLTDRSQSSSAGILLGDGGDGDGGGGGGVVVVVQTSITSSRAGRGSEAQVVLQVKRGAAERVSLTVADCVYRSRTRSASTRLASECEWTVLRSLANTTVAYSTSVCVLRRVCIRVRVRSLHERTATAQSDHSQNRPPLQHLLQLYCDCAILQLILHQPPAALSRPAPRTLSLSLALPLPSIDPACRVSDGR